MKTMKKWKKPVIKVMSSEELNIYIKAAARSEFCWAMDSR